VSASGTEWAPRLRVERHTSDGVFAHPGERADVAVIIVTYNSEDHIGSLLDSLRDTAHDLLLRVVVVDNDSSDGTLAALGGIDDIVVVSSGGNLGYAGGINVGLRRIDDAASVLIVNPDLAVDPGAITTLVERMARTGAGIVVPRIVDEKGTTYPSIRREPTVSRGIGDAVFGSRLPRRPAWLSEIDAGPESYRLARPIDWATGAALLVRRDLCDHLGDWDERFFLYSEETEYFHRARAAGAEVWFEPAATVTHHQGGSGTNHWVTSLMAVNRVRYAEATSSRATVGAARAIAVLHEGLRVHKTAHRLALRMLLRRRRWSELPKSSRGSTRIDVPAGAVIIPAHNESTVLARTLTSLIPVIQSGRVEVIVVCNGCSDDTAKIARSFEGVTVIEIENASKTEALNTADRVAASWPRLYLDADIEIAPEAVRDVFGLLSASSGVLAARPSHRYETQGAARSVRAYYRARERTHERQPALWGAGAYAVSEDGHSRFSEFPPVIGDDLWIDRQFSTEEKSIVSTRPVVVRAPRTSSSLLGTLRRTHRGNTELDAATSAGTLSAVLAGVRGPASAADAVVYIWFAVAARLPSRSGSREQRWERDESNRAELG
jgi:GT2 family glycosyltransferase